MGSEMRVIKPYLVNVQNRVNQFQERTVKIFRKDFLREILREWEIVRNFAALKARSAALGHHDSLMV